MSWTYYSIKRGDKTLFDNKNQSCYAESFRGTEDSTILFFNSYVKEPDTFFELYLNLKGFPDIRVQWYLKFLQKLGFDFTFSKEKQLPRNVGEGWLVRFDLHTVDLRKMKTATYLIRILWEMDQKNEFIEYLRKVYIKGRKKFPRWSLFKYAFFHYPVYKGWWAGHSPLHRYEYRNYLDDLDKTIKETSWSNLWYNLFVKIEPIKLKLVPINEQDSITNLDKYISE